jgi:hypothetical protein
MGGRVRGEAKGKTYETYLRGMPQRVGTAVGAGVGCSVRSLSVTASKWMDFEGIFPFQNRTLGSERAIWNRRRIETPLRPCSRETNSKRTNLVWKWGEGREGGKEPKRRGEQRRNQQAPLSHFFHQISPFHRGNPPLETPDVTPEPVSYTASPVLSRP